jgi:hypothetical protein
MSGYIHYSRSACSLDDINSTIAVDGFDSESFRQQMVSANSAIRDPRQANAVHQPFVIPSGRGGPSVCAPVCTPAEHDVLASTAHAVGGAATMALAELVIDQKIADNVGNLNTFGGNGIGAAAVTSSHVLRTIAKYDQAVADYEQLRNHRAAPRTLKGKQMAVKRAYQEMATELNRRSLNLLHKNAFRTQEVKNLNGRVVRESIPVQNTADVQKLAKFARVARVAGPGFIALDGALRYNTVQNKRLDNDPTWKREAFVQAGGFAAGIATGAAIGLTIGGLIVFSPVGLIIGFAAAGAMAVIVDKGFQAALGTTYDWVVDD